MSLIYQPKRERRRLQWRHIRRGILFAGLTWFVLLNLLIAAIVLYGQFDFAQPADVIIVLGSGLRRDGEPGPALIRRSQRAAELWQEGIAPYVICTGSITSRTTRSEAAACAELLRDSGVPDHAIWLEEHSHSTEENAIYSKVIMQAEGWQTAVIVSDRYHLLRANWLFALRGIPAYTSPVDGYPNFATFVYGMSREVAAIHWQTVKEIFGLPQTHLAGI